MLAIRSEFEKEKCGIEGQFKDHDVWVFSTASAPAWKNWANGIPSACKTPFKWRPSFPPDIFYGPPESILETFLRRWHSEAPTLK